MSTENKNTEEKIELTPAQIQAQKEADKVKETGAKVHELTVEDKIAYLRSPNRMVMSLAMAEQSKGDIVGMAEVLLENCWISGDDEIKTDDAYFLGAMSEIEDIIEIKSASLKKY